ncbi:HigA family addiction module antidote protein [Pseudoduganella sp. FT55W]|uniref:HigA family addiction module antidote protein n=2 Tax=Duganella rivi TaxID=2666083 RepID=A0A7X4GWE6_9BURK|nr:HigA family addiction module antidote protein [Duganella rivi]
MLKNGMRPVHPGEILFEDYIKPSGVSLSAVALALDMPHSELVALIEGRAKFTADIALRLERYWGSEANGWLALQVTYDLRIAEG